MIPSIRGWIRACPNRIQTGSSQDIRVRPLVGADRSAFSTSRTTFLSRGPFDTFQPALGIGRVKNHPISLFRSESESSSILRRVNFEESGNHSFFRTLYPFISL